MTDLKRLHEVHYSYPNTPRRMDKTIYVFDCLLRAAQTGAYKNLVYYTNTEKAAMLALQSFKDFLWRQSEHYNCLVTEKDSLLLYESVITFAGEIKATSARNLKGRNVNFIEDLW